MQGTNVDQKTTVNQKNHWVDRSTRTVKTPCPTCGRLFATVDAKIQHITATHDDPNWKPGKGQPKVKVAPICPVCEKPATITATRYGARAECCGLRSWGLKPLVSADTLVARQVAHAVFDEIWKSGKLGRGECYRRLAAAMGMTSEECHISRMHERHANRVVEIVRSGGLRENEKEIE